MLNYKLAIFDWDGTLVDSIKLIVNSIHLTAEDLGLPLLADQTVKNIIGLKLDQAIMQLYPYITEKQLTIFLKKYAEIFITLEKTTPKLYPNVLETLILLKQKGYLLAIATGKSRKGLDRILQALKLSHFFDASRCSDETTGKPDPTMLRELLSQFKLTSQQAIMVGDASFDLQMARNATIEAIAVSYGAQDTKTLQSYHPKAVISDFAELTYYLIS